VTPLLGKRTFSARDFIEEFIGDFLSVPENNNLGPGRSEKTWDGFRLGFSSGADDLYGFLKDHIGDFHWTPAEAFELGGVASAKPRPEELTVVSWALGHTESTKAANRGQTRFPSEPWARSRFYGQAHLLSLQEALVAALTARGNPAVAPSLLPQAAVMESANYGRASNWSERHVAFISGLGTFGLSGGLITELGQTVRLGSLIVQATIPPTPRPYSDPFAYCLYYQDGSCVACLDRCPSGSIDIDHRDKGACSHHLRPVIADYVKREYGFEGAGCGLCQTNVPCESGIPVSCR
jgi:epoxyqueuosine reductase